MDVPRIQEELRRFAHERDWERFHNPKNLAMALSAEAGELIEIFQWMSEEESRAAGADPELRRSISEEIADIAIYLIRLSDVLGVDLAAAIDDKIDSNSRRYTVERSRGRSQKIPRSDNDA
jgi:NTP pyrophosphatase (non-canonical NTP hydrolase)